MSTTVSVADVLAAVERAFPPEWAEPWDQIGLLCGDRETPVRSIGVSLDPDRAAIREAATVGHQVLLTHHPAFLTPPERIVRGGGPSGLLFEALAAGIALIAAHTNLDRAPDASATLPQLLGFDCGSPLEAGTQPVAIVTAFVPPDSADAIRAAMQMAGAGTIGDYEGCAFLGSGEGRFRPAPDSSPYVGSPGSETTVEEVRIEMVAPPRRAGAVAEAARAAHPYEEPVILATEGALTRGSARLGRVSDLDAPITLADLADLISERFDCAPRVWGAPTTTIRRAAFATGSAGSLIGAAGDVEADVLVAGEVRYHDASAASSEGLCIVEMGHDVSEWPLVPILAAAVEPLARENAITLSVDEPRRGWWTP